MRKKVIIIGGGFAGIAAAKGLGHSNLDVLVIDKSNHHLFQPLLYQVASAALSPGDIATPIREVLSQFKNIRVIQDEVQVINKSYKKIKTKEGHSFNYDYLIIGIGSKPNYYNHHEWQTFAPGLKSLENALSIRNRVLSSFEKAERTPECKSREGLLSFVVVGGGPTGVELAGAFAEISKKTLVNDFRNIQPADAKVYLVEAGERILSSFSESLSTRAESYLKELGVTILKGGGVSLIDSTKIVVGEKEIFCENIIWAAGNKISSLLNQLETPQDEIGRIKVNEYLNIPSDESIFVLGDAANFSDRNGNILPSLAPVASQQGRYVAKRILNKTQKSFAYFDKGAMATIGRSKAIAEYGKIKISGVIAWLGWCFIHILFLINFRNRFKVFTQWALAFLFFKRGVRIINGTNLIPKEELRCTDSEQSIAEKL